MTYQPANTSAADASASTSHPAPTVTKTERTISQATEILRRSLEFGRGKTVYEAGIGAEWMESYARIAERFDLERCYVVSRYPYEASLAIVAFAGGFFDHPE